MTAMPEAPSAVSPCPCCGGASAGPAAVPVERSRFFTGKFLTARDFRDEQAYFLARHRLHQRALHGWGIVCGLEVRHHVPDCFARGWLVVSPGIALDCYGREIVLHEETPVQLNRLFEQQVGCGEEGRYPDPHTPERTKFLLGVRYGEVCFEQVPLLYDEEGCGQRTVPNRILERPCFRYRVDKPGDGCWGPPQPPIPTYSPLPAADPRDAKPCETGGHDFCQPGCPCGEDGFVPLGLFEYEQKKDRVVVLREEYAGRRYVFGPLHPYTLTHVCHVNWHHCGKTRLDALEKDYREGRAEDEKTHSGHYHGHEHPEYLRLTIRFDRPLCGTLLDTDPPHGVGLYRRILRVRYEAADGSLMALPGPGIAHLSPDRDRLHYDVPMHCLRDMRERCKDPILHVTLDCDFLPDHKGRAVDGNHLRGALAHGGKTGDGVEGGVFESWFQLDW